VLDGLSLGYQPRVQSRRALVLGDDLFFLLDNAVDYRTGVALGALAEVSNTCCRRSGCPSSGFLEHLS
jgi:hypothetical protein